MDAKDNRFFERFSPEGKAHLLGQLTHHTLPDGAWLFHEGDEAAGICLILEGEIEILKAAGVRDEILGVFAAGDYFGEVAVLDGQGRSTAARARGEVAIAILPGAALLEALDREPVSLTLSLFQNVLSHLRRTNALFISEIVRKEKLSLVGEMASSLMHDLRNPLTGIQLAAELIKMDHDDDETVLCCDNIRLQCDRVVAMAGELLEFSRGETKLDLSQTETTTFLSTFTRLNNDFFQTKEIDFSFNAEPAQIEVDSMRLLRLLQNLVTNAVDALATQPGARIDVYAGVAEGIFYLTVSDNGPGIPPEIQDRLFEPFVTHGKKGGTGLGMAIARNVVTAHGGTITFETTPGAGTCFVVKLPQFASAA